MKNLFAVFVPPVIPGQPPYYYAIYGVGISIMGIILSSTALFAFNLTEKVSRIVYCIGCFLSICFGVYCGNILHPLVAAAVGVVLTIISIFDYFKSIEWKREESYVLIIRCQFLALFSLLIFNSIKLFLIRSLLEPFSIVIGFWWWFVVRSSFFAQIFFSRNFLLR